MLHSMVESVDPCVQTLHVAVSRATLIRRYTCKVKQPLVHH